MLENIALIKEVHAFMSISKAEALAAGLLEAIDLDYIGPNRVTSCSNTEIFYVMFMRALMSDAKNIIIVTPYSILYNLRDIKEILNKINIIKNEKNVLILDTLNQEINYKGSECTIVK